MSKRVAADGLFRALCPSIDAALLCTRSWAVLERDRDGVGLRRSQHTGQARVLHTGSPPAARRIRPSQLHLRQQNRASGTAAAHLSSPHHAPSRVAAERRERRPDTHLGVPRTKQLGSRVGSSEDPWERGQKLDGDAVAQINRSLGWESELGTVNPKVPDDGPVTAAALCAASPAVLQGMVAFAPMPVLYESLRLLRGYPNQGDRIRSLIRHLVEGCGERPNMFLYEALVVANWDTTTGSASELMAILAEMNKAGVQPSLSFCHSALQLLAIHPDYLTRNTVLQIMKNRDMELDDEGKCNVALGLLRDGQNEMALEHWDQVCRGKTEIPEWVFEAFVYVLGMRGFMGEALQMVRQRLDASKEVSLRVWFYLLEECSRNLHYEGTAFIWERMVRSGTLEPADGVCLNVLNTASRHGDATLATAAIQLLSKRAVKLGYHHYEPLLESYVRDGDLENAFRVLCIMRDVGAQQPVSASTRAIYAVLKDAPERADEVVGMLKKLRKEHELPVAAINVLLEAIAQTGDMKRTLDVYRQVSDLCRSGPTQETFTLLLEACDSAEPGVFLVAEMDRFSIRPSPPILDSLIRCFAGDGSLDVAMLYLKELSRLDRGTEWLRKRTLVTVLRRCHRDRDPRLPLVVEEAKKAGYGQLDYAPKQ